MLSKSTNEMGTIGIDNEVIARLAGTAAMECYGVVGMAARSMRDGLVGLLKKESLSKGVRLQTQDEGDLLIDLHIIVEYGTNIVAIAQTLMDNVRYNVEESVGLTVREVNIFIEGVRV
ncbi:MAG: Asp23/Gls24 family envelope stress response protein [Defluviitaleaceae bacterium]|nr:Asp23/Gls24 family envelope stress response protein [Defluviitaleaceae bacterium]